MVMMVGIEAQTLTTCQKQKEHNHAQVTVWFGDIKTAITREGTETKYEVVYIEIKDKFVNNDGKATVATTIRPNAAENMRSRMKALSNQECTYMPLWMKTVQADAEV